MQLHADVRQTDLLIITRQGMPMTSAAGVRADWWRAVPLREREHNGHRTAVVECGAVECGAVVVYGDVVWYMVL